MKVMTVGAPFSPLVVHLLRFLVHFSGWSHAILMLLLIIACTVVACSILRGHGVGVASFDWLSVRL